jgi:Flp pilus assembly protein TadD
MLRAVVAASVITLVLAVGCANPFGNPGAVAEAYAEAGRYDEATREIELAVRAYPSDPQLRRQAAGIYADSGNLDQAVGHLEVVAVQISPGDADAWIELGELETRRSNVADAYVAYRRAAQLAPEDIRAVSGLALSADSLGFDEEAEEAYADWADLEAQERSAAEGGATQ